MSAVKLWHPSGKDCHIGLTSSHTLVVSGKKEGTDVPKIFRREAIARGCIPVGMEDEEQPKQGFDRRQVIKDVINKMLESDEPGMFTGAGKPNLNALVKLTGFAVDRSEANDVLDEIQGIGKHAGKAENDDTPSMVAVG